MPDLQLAPLVAEAFDKRELLCDRRHADAVLDSIALLDREELRVASRQSAEWVVHERVKQAPLLYFALQPMTVHEAGMLQYYDKTPTKHKLQAHRVRVVPPGVARYASFLAPGATLMPGYVNVGARVGIVA